MPTTIAMERCPFCRMAPEVGKKLFGKVHLWVAGCDEHFKDVVAQGSYPSLKLAWNAFVKSVLSPGI